MFPSLDLEEVHLVNGRTLSAYWRPCPDVTVSVMVNRYGVFIHRHVMVRHNGTWDTVFAA